MEAYTDKKKAEIYNAVLTGYYTAYYVNGGKNVKSPEELMKKMFTKKQSFEEGIAQIEKIKKLEHKED